MRGQSITIICCLVFILTTGTVLAEGPTLINLSIVNSPPQVGYIETSSPNILETENNIVVWCNTTITDLNSNKDIADIWGVIWDVNNTVEGAEDDFATHYTSAYVTVIESVNLSKSIEAYFNVAPQANLGLWKCKISARDTKNTIGYNITDISFYSRSCSNEFLDSGEILIDCGGGGCPMCLEIPYIYLDTYPGKTLEGRISVYSRTPERITIIGHDISELKSEVDTIQKSNIIIEPLEMTLLSYQATNFSIRIDVPSNITPSIFILNLTFRTNNSVVAISQIIVNVLLYDVEPTVGEMEITYPAILEENSTKEISCNATITDDNGLNTIAEINARFYRVGEAGLGQSLTKQSPTEQSPAKQLSIREYNLAPKTTVTSNISNVSVRAYYTFELEPTAHVGTWRCEVNTTDSADLTGSNYLDVLVYNQTCSNGVRDINEELIDCGRDCQPCLIGENIYVEGKSGARSRTIMSMKSYAVETINITKFSVSDLLSGNAIIPADKVGVNPNSMLIPPGENVEFSVIFLIPDGMDKSVYNGTITAHTNTQVEETIENRVQVISRGKGYMSILSEYTCLKRPIYLKLIDEDSESPIENASISVYLEGEMIETMNTDVEGDTAFIPAYEGVYNITANKISYIQEETLTDIVICGKNQTCDDGIKNQDEEQVDCGGLCPPCSCYDGVANNNEEYSDCGGQCPPCHCFDGIYSGNEKGIDCGGDCQMCPDIGTIMMISVDIPAYAITDEELKLQTTNETGYGIQTLLIIKNPEGRIKYLRTDREGFILFKPDSMGNWEITASKPGYIPINFNLRIIDKIIIQTGSSLTVLLIVGIPTILIIRLRKHSLADKKSIQKLIESDAISKHRRIFTTVETVQSLADSITKKIKSVELKSGGIEEADKLRQDYDISLELSHLLVLSKQIRAKTVITAEDVSDELHNAFSKLKIIDIQTLL